MQVWKFLLYFGIQSTFMKQQELIKEIGHIRALMEKSSKFMSISGLSGVLIGCYALIGAMLGYATVYGFKSTVAYRDFYLTDDGILYKLVLIAGLVLLLSVFTGWFMAKRKAEKAGQSIWNTTSRGLFVAMAIPLGTGGLLSLILLYKEYYGMIASTLLIFYGLALTSAGPFTFREVRWLGILQIVLGLIALCLPGYGIIFWSLGFGILHIIYGLIVHKRYER